MSPIMEITQCDGSRNTMLSSSHMSFGWQVKHVCFLCLWHCDIWNERLRWPRAKLKYSSCERPQSGCAPLLGKVPHHAWCQRTVESVHTCCLCTHSYIHTYTQTHLSPWLFVCLHVAFMSPVCPHDCKCKMWIWMVEKRELVFVK